MGNRKRGRRSQGSRAGAGFAGGFRLAARRSAKTRNGDRARFRDQLFAGSSLRSGTSRLFLSTTRRLDQIRRESAKKIRGHFPVEFSLREMGRTLGGNGEYR